MESLEARQNILESMQPRVAAETVLEMDTQSATPGPALGNGGGGSGAGAEGVAPPGAGLDAAGGGVGVLGLGRWRWDTAPQTCMCSTCSSACLLALVPNGQGQGVPFASPIPLCVNPSVQLHGLPVSQRAPGRVGFWNELPCLVLALLHWVRAS